MSTHAQTQALGAEVSQVETGVRALGQATADVTGEEIGGIRQRGADALDHELSLYGRVRNTALHGSRAADKAVHQHPYPAIALGIGLGAALGYLVNHCWSSPRK